ncbi:MAG: hypothetical protein NTW07_00955, partial [candidate division Zixibacteria bacterium]|nr:hypothetical protein [candidate division Zixibacteria bacterium]
MNVATGPYFDDEGQPILRNSVIVAADILGYKQKIQWASQREEKLEPLLYNLYVAIKESFQSVGDTDRIRRFAKMMTDDVLVAYPLPTTDNGITVLLGACLDIARFQANMIGYGLAVRGGISVDKIHM